MLIRLINSKAGLFSHLTQLQLPLHYVFKQMQYHWFVKKYRNILKLSSPIDSLTTCYLH